jgi:hypothetical protein
LWMKRITRPVLVGVLLLLVLSSACNLPAPTPPTGTMTQDSGPTSSPAIPATSTPIAAIIPITGENVVQMQCQFCVNDRTHSVFVIPEFAIFDVETTITPVTCLTAEVVNGKRVLVCHGEQNTSFNLKICSDPTNCLLYPVALQPCPLLPNTGSPSTTNSTSTPMAPVFLTPINTLLPPANTPVLPAATSTQTSGAPPQPTSPVVPTTQPTSTPVAPPPATSTDVPPPPPTTGGGEEGGDLVICHISPGNPDNRKTMTVSQSSWDSEHSRHGDSLGECP